MYSDENLRNVLPPTSVKEMQKLGWDRPDVVLFTGDAFIDHPSFGAAVISRVLMASGYRVAVVPQPNWRDDLRDFKKFGEPRLFFGVTAGSMDSMINHYTAQKRLRHDDAYTPDGKAGQRPDYAVNVYSRILKDLFPEVPIVLGGVEASLRRFTHYDYWQDKLMPSILEMSGADILIYGMGERPVIAVADAFADGLTVNRMMHIPQIGYISKNKPKGEVLVLPSFEDCKADPKVFAQHFHEIEKNANSMNVPIIVEPIPHDGGYVVINPPYKPMTTEELDEVFDLPYTKKPHPRYKDKRIPAYDMIKFSINTHRGCFGGCSFCTIAAHQGKYIQSRSIRSITDEIKELTKRPDFKGVLSDLGAPTANMYMMGGNNRNLCAKCHRKSCLFPSVCKNLNKSHESLLDLYKAVSHIKGVKKAFIGSGIRYDLFLDENGFFDDTCRRYFEELVKDHTSGRLKVAPEHTEDRVLKQMNKPSFKLFEKLRFEFDRLNRREKLNYQLIPYFISSHPGCTMEDMRRLAVNPALKGITLEQVQDFTPTPMTKSTVMYYSGINPDDGQPVFTEHSLEKKKKQKNYFLDR